MSKIASFLFNDAKIHLFFETDKFILLKIVNYSIFVLTERLELSRPKITVPKTVASTNSATLACLLFFCSTVQRYIFFFKPPNLIC